MEKEKVVKEMKESFRELKKSSGIESEFKNLEDAFHISDGVLIEGFVSDNFGRQIRNRIAEVFMNWNEYLHGLIMPNPQNILNLSESKVFGSEEKTEITNLMKKSMEIISRNGLITLTKDLKEEAKLIDDSLTFWEEEFQPKIKKLVQKINLEWGELQ